MSVSSSEDSAYMACLHCSPTRTVWLRNSQGESPSQIVKIYVSGSMADAEHELEMGRLAAGPGVIKYDTFATDEQTNRPCITIAFAEGKNLDMLVSEQGAIPASQAVALIASIARTLTRLHNLQLPNVPRGMCHGDVKPHNILAAAKATLLLDFEHACIVGSAPTHSFSGGTNLYAPPEASRGEPAAPEFDIFGLGATLAFLLHGGSERCLPQHPEVDALVAECCAEAPSDRPTASELVQRCDRLIAVLLDDDAEQNLHDWASGALKSAPTSLAAPRAAVWPVRQRLLGKIPQLLTPPESIEGDPEGLLRQLELTSRIISRFPRNKQAVAHRQRLLCHSRELLRTAAAHAHALNKDEQFDQALHWLRSLESLISFGMRLAGGLSVLTQLDPSAHPGAAQRAPIEYLRSLIIQSESARRELQNRTEEISAAEQVMDLTLAEQCLDSLASDYGGTSRTVAERRDQLHRLGFYLDRIARSQPKVQRIQPMWDPEAMGPLQLLIHNAAEALAKRPQTDAIGSGAIGLRSLQITLSNVVDEFPHLLQAPPALEALSQALINLTDQAWSQLEDAEERLQIVPVPVRPLQIALGRLDTLRMLEAFVDGPNRPVSDLLDGLERLRIGLDQARSARDRLAENAENALARGHWTTGLFDMERAVERLNSDEAVEHAEANRMRERLKAARRTKQDIETAVRRNVELSAKYSSLEDDPLSTYEARARALQDRRDCLMFLGLHVPNHRAVLYRKDVRSVETQIAIERAADAERRLDSTTDPTIRLRLARNIVEFLSATGSSSDSKMEPSGRLLRLQDHWRTVAAKCQQSIDNIHNADLARRRMRRRMTTIAAIIILASVTAIGIAMNPGIFGEPTMAAEKPTEPK